MFDLRLEYNRRFLRNLKRRIVQTEDRFNNAMLGKKGRLANKALSKLTREPGPAVKPIEWSSLRQRRAFFATKGFGRGIPTRRTGALLSAWKVFYQWTRGGGSITLGNDNPAMPFVQGDQAQQFHKNTGWVQVDDVVDDFMKEASDVVIEQWFGAGDPFQ